MKRLVLNIVMLFLAVQTMAQEVSNVRFVQEGQQVVISYELSEWVDTVEVEVSTDGGYTYGLLKMEHVYGDVGGDVPPGAIREITWDVLQDCERLQGDSICFRVTAYEIEISAVDLIEEENEETIEIGPMIVDEGYVSIDVEDTVEEIRLLELDTSIFLCPDEEPSFPGGVDSLYIFLQNNTKYPDLARDNNITGTVVIRFVVEKDGSITRASILREIGGGCGQEVLRVVNKMPKWNPAKKSGIVVRSEFTLPVPFKLI